MYSVQYKCKALHNEKGATTIWFKFIYVLILKWSTWSGNFFIYIIIITITILPENDFVVKSKIYSFSPRLVLNHIMYSLDVLSVRNLFSRRICLARNELNMTICILCISLPPTFAWKNELPELCSLNIKDK